MLVKEGKSLTGTKVPSTNYRCVCENIVEQDGKANFLLTGFYFLSE